MAKGWLHTEKGGQEKVGTEERRRKIENSKIDGWLRKHGDLSMEVGD